LAPAAAVARDATILPPLISHVRVWRIIRTNPKRPCDSHQWASGRRRPGSRRFVRILCRRRRVHWL